MGSQVSKEDLMRREYCSDCVTYRYDPESGYESCVHPARGPEEPLPHHLDKCPYKVSVEDVRMVRQAVTREVE